MLPALILFAALLSSRYPFWAEATRDNHTCDTATTFVSDTISLHVRTGVLRGTLVMPNIHGKVPVIVLLGGSGPIDRDGNVQRAEVKNDAVKLLAEGLGRRGIASVRYDRRGIGESASVQVSESSFVFTALVEDASNWITALLKDSRFSRVILAGHSEGSLVAILAAQKTDVAGVVTLNGPGRPHWKVLHDQLAASWATEQVARADSIVQKIIRGDTGVVVPTEMRALFRPSVQPYLRSLYSFDPAIELGRLGVPVLVVYGTTDLNVGAGEAEILIRRSRTARIARIEGMNHLLKSASDLDTQRRTYVDPSVPLAPGLVKSVTEFVCHLAGQ